MYTIGKFKRLYGFNGECNFVEKCGSIQTIHTPESLVEKMIDIAKPGIDDKILVMFNVEFVIALKNMGCKNITYFSDSERMTNLVEKMYINNIGNSEVEVVYMENFKKEFRNLSKILENMKFDLIISNPPYNQNLDLKILKEIYDIGEKICFVHPAGWLYDNKRKSKLYNDVRELVKEHFISYEKIDDVNKLFGICLSYSDVFITLLNKKETGVINKIYDIDIHGNSETYKSLKNKILSYNNTLNDKVTTSINMDSIIYRVSLSGIGRHTNPRYEGDNVSGAYAFIPKTIQEECFGINSNKYLKFLFDTETEMINFKDYLKTKIARFCLSIYKINQHTDSGELASVPCMPTYTRPWTDEDVAKELGLTDEELAWAINWIPDYYPEDKEKYAKYKKYEV